MRSADGRRRSRWAGRSNQDAPERSGSVCGSDRLKLSLYPKPLTLLSGHTYLALAYLMGWMSEHI